MDSEGKPNMEAEPQSTMATKETPTAIEERELNNESVEELAMETEIQPELEPEANKIMKVGVKQAIDSQKGEGTPVPEQMLDEDEDEMPGLIPNAEEVPKQMLDEDEMPGLIPNAEEVPKQMLDEDEMPGLIPNAEEVPKQMLENVQDQSPLTDAQQYLIQVFEDLSNMDEVTDGKLCISELQGLLFEGRRQLKIPFKNVRWIDRHGYAIHSLEASFNKTRVISLSYEDPKTEDISYIFFACDEITQDVLERIYQLKLIQSKTFDVDRYGSQVMEVLKEQPMQSLAFVSLKVRPKGETVNSHDSDTKPMQCKMFLDLECISFFEGPSAEPSYQIKFWKEEGENVVEFIKVMQWENEIQLETDKFIFVLTSSEKLQEHLKQMSSRKKHFFTDVQNLLGLQLQRSSVSAGMFPRPEPPLSKRGSFSKAGSFQRFEMGPLKIECEMDEAQAELAGVEDFQVQWIALESDLNEIIQTGAIQETEIQSGGLDPNNKDHLECALDDVASQLTDQRLDLALSRLQAARGLFTTSNQSNIKQIFMADNLEILKKLYFRSLLR